MPSYYLGYLTANDDPSFLVDYLNIKNMVRYRPGVTPIRCCMVVSEVSERTEKDVKKVSALRQELLRSPAFEEVRVIWKSNMGRDFSSAKTCLLHFQKSAKSGDVVMMKNRSGYGPLVHDWYSAYVDANKRLKDGGLTGSTINQSGHPEDESGNESQTHVQTYVYLSRWEHLEPIIYQFPGSEENERFNVIQKGEIGLSRSFMERELSLNALAWEGVYFNRETPIRKELPGTDIKKYVTELPIRHKYRPYLIRKESILDGLRWDPTAFFKVTAGGWVYRRWVKFSTSSRQKTSGLRSN